MTTGASELSVADLAKAFGEVGLSGGDSVIVHSSFRSLMPVEEGPAGVIRALLDALGPGGNLMLPTFNYSSPLPQPYFDPQATPGRTGVVAETGRRWCGAVRSLHPTHSVAVIGPDRDQLTRDHLQCRAFGIDSPIDRLAKRGGKVLLIGVGHIVNSAVHLGEEYAEVPKAPWPCGLPTVKVRMPDGRVIDHQFDTSPSCSSAFGGVEHALRRKDRIRDLRLGQSKFQLMDAAAVIDCTREMIAEKPDVLLCTWPGCMPCTGARANLRRAGRLP